MENTFKKAYTKKTNPDGTIELSYRSKRFGENLSPGLAMAMLFSIYLASCVATYPLMPTERAVGGAILVDKASWWFAGTGLAIVVTYFLFNTRDKIIIKPKEGILFRGQSLPYAEMGPVGVMTQNSGSKTSGYLYTETNGTTAKITRYISPDLAREIHREISLHHPKASG